MKNKPLKILFDVSPLINSKKSGVGYYTERLLIALAKKYPNELSITGHYFNFLGKKQVSLPDLPNITYKSTTVFPSKLINILRRLHIELPVEFFCNIKADFIIYPNFVGFRSLRRTPSAVVIHDLGYLDCPEYLQPGNRSFLAQYVPKAVRRSRFIITISEATRVAMHKHYATPDSKFVINPIPPEPHPASEQKLENVDGKFILFVSTLEPRKNFIGLVRGYMQLPEEVRKDYSLVLAGGSGWNVESELAEIAKLQKSGEKILLTGYISQEEKTWLLNNASAAVLPSHYEGFGMPILEAMAAGAPTAVSDIPVFHEVSGDASLFFDQNDPSSIAQTLTQLLSDANLQKELRDKGYDRVQSMSWDRIAQSIYERIKSEL